MSTISLRLPDSLHERIREIAKSEGISINQLINTAVAEKLSALLTEEYLVSRAKRGSRKKFEKALSRVRDVEADSEDNI
jgi:predicted transcriptional regulator